MVVSGLFLYFSCQLMRANLEPLIDTLFEEDELFAQDFQEDDLNRILFIRKMGIYVEVRVSPPLPPPPSATPSTSPLLFSTYFVLRKSMSSCTIELERGIPLPEEYPGISFWRQQGAIKAEF